MAEKYWLTDEFIAEMDGLQVPDIYKTRGFEAFKERPRIASETVPEWWWVDATEHELCLNIHQSYFDIAASAMIGNKLSRVNPEDAKESRFTAATTREEPQWARISVNLGEIFRHIDNENIHDIHHEASIVISEFDSMVAAVQFLRFHTHEPTTQLILPFWGSITAGGTLSLAARDYIKAQADNSAHEIEYSAGTAVMRSINNTAFGGEAMACGVGVGPDGRFLSNTGVVMGTGSLEVLPEEIFDDDRGYQYTSHNLDSPFTHLWAFCGLAKLLGDMHRYYTAEAASA
jgi:hypothetical protein